MTLSCGVDVIKPSPSDTVLRVGAHSRFQGEENQCSIGVHPSEIKTARISYRQVMVDPELKNSCRTNSEKTVLSGAETGNGNTLEEYVPNM